MKCSSRRAYMVMAFAAGMACSVHAQQVLFDTGPHNQVMFNGAQTNLGFSSGNLTASAGMPQRWTAQGFTLSGNSTITTVGVSGFDGVFGGWGPVFFDEWRVVIYSRTGSNLPGAVVASATVPAATVGNPMPDPGLDPILFFPDMYFEIPVNFSLPAGDYYLNVYGNNSSGADANFAWLTNTQLDVLLSPVNTPVVISDAQGVFMWRSTAYPSPGFQRYTTPAIDIVASPFLPDWGPGSAGHPTPAQDPQYLYNTRFRLEGTTSGGVCYANCDGSTTPPILNVADFTCFLNKFAAGDPYANCDGSTTPPVLNVADFTCFLNKFAAGC
jgi:hypothetical protein